MNPTGTGFLYRRSNSKKMSNSERRKKVKRLEGQSVICEGRFNGGDIEPGTFHGGEIEPGTFHGGEIEPGTFHAHTIQKDSNSEERNVSSNNGEMPDLEDENKEQETRLGPVGVACY
jgi:hypothetical protein